MDNTKIWDALRSPPAEACKKITGGRLAGMTDIKPQWRYQAMTEVFGPCGDGWYFEVINKAIEPASDGQMVAFVDVLLYFLKDDGEYSNPVPGNGGSMFIANEKHGPHTSDEAYKMATTDALSTAMKMIGVGSDIYMGKSSGSKYARGNPHPASAPKKDTRPAPPPKKNTVTDDPGFPPASETKENVCTMEQINKLYEIGASGEVTFTDREVNQVCNWFKVGEKLSYVEAEEMIKNFNGIVDRYVDYINEMKT